MDRCIGLAPAILRYALGADQDEDERAEAAAHLVACEDCREDIAAVEAVVTGAAS